MISGKVYFVGALANVDSSILTLKLDNGYEIISMSEKDGVLFLSNLEGSNSYSALRRFFFEFHCYNSNEKKFYFISKCFGPVSFEDKPELTFEINEWQNEFNSYIDSFGKVLRLFKEGNFFIPCNWVYLLDTVNNNIYPFGSMRSIWHIGFGEYVINPCDIAIIQKLFKEIRFPLEDSILQLAHDNFETSYRVPILHTQFLMAMIALETLFHPSDRDELTYRISRSIAVLLSENVEEGTRIFKDVKTLYARRSALVHSGNPKQIEYKHLSLLRDYVRKSILKLNEMDIPMEKLRDILHVSGFGDLKVRGNYEN